MRFSLVFSLLLTSSLSFAAPKKVADFYSESTKLLEGLQGKSDNKLKVKKLNELKASLEATQKEYKKLNPKEGTDAENEVNLFYFTFEPLFDFSKKTSWSDKECVKMESTVKENNEQPNKEQAEALKWLKLFCD